MSLANLSLVLGLGIAAPQIWQLTKPDAWRRWSAGFPRSKPLGYLLMAIATAWFVWNVRNETLADFSKYKPILLATFVAIGALTCIYVSDFLAASGLALLLLLVAKSMVDTARWHDSEWRWLVSGLAYLWVFFGIWLTISPWRLRDFLAWHNRTDTRIRALAASRLGVALVLVVLGLTAFRAS